MQRNSPRMVNIVLQSLPYPHGVLRCEYTHPGYGVNSLRRTFSSETGHAGTGRKGIARALRSPAKKGCKPACCRLTRSTRASIFETPQTGGALPPVCESEGHGPASTAGLTRLV